MKNNFKHMCFLHMQSLTNFPYIEADFDALTNYELLCKIVEYLNKVIANENAQNDAINELTTAFNNLKDYVDNYFDNLDVQDEINNKLDEMAESGELADIIAQYLQLAGLLTFNTKNDLINAENVVNGSTALTLGDATINDGKTTIYKITNQVESGKEQISLASGLYATVITDGIIKNETDFINAINDSNQNGSYIILGTITINSTINLTSIDQCANKSFTGGTIVLNDELFSGTGLQYFTLPNFTNCNFIGNGHSIVDDSSYTINGRFVNCNFVNCRFIYNGNFVQSPKFVNCKVSNNEGYDFITTKRIYEARFVNCQCENDNHAHFIVANDTTANSITMDDVSFVNCIFEGQSNEVVIAKDVSRLDFINLYTEGNDKSFLKITDSTRSSQGIIMLSFKNCRLQCNNKSKYFISVENQSKFASNYTSLAVEDCTIDVCTLSDFYDFKHYITNNIVCFSNGAYKPASENSKAYTQKNSVVDFNTTTTCVVKKFPALVTCDSSTSGAWDTYLFFVSLSQNNVPHATCLSHPNVTPSATYDSETGYVNVTLGITTASYLNRTGVLLSGIANNLNPNDYWGSASGYSVD